MKVGASTFGEKIRFFIIQSSFTDYLNGVQGKGIPTDWYSYRLVFLPIGFPTDKVEINLERL